MLPVSRLQVSCRTGTAFSTTAAAAIGWSDDADSDRAGRSEPAACARAYERLTVPGLVGRDDGTVAVLFVGRTLQREFP
jgi:hypothetical protein